MAIQQALQPLSSWIAKQARLNLGFECCGDMALSGSVTCSCCCRWQGLLSRKDVGSISIGSSNSRRKQRMVTAMCSATPAISVSLATQQLVQGIRLAAGFAPVVLSVFVSQKLQIGLENEIQIATLRSFTQLMALGFALKLLFDTGQQFWSFFSIIGMVCLAGHTAGGRAKQLPASHFIGTLSLGVGATGIVALMVLLRVFPLEPWFIIPTAAHVIGHSMAMVGGTLSCLQQEIQLHRGQIEAALALGATPQEAVQAHLRRAFSLGMAPIVDEVKIMGLVALPGNMTGMLMGGASPLEAVKLQLQIVNVVLGAAALSCLISVALGWRAFFSDKHQLADSITC